MFRTRLSRTCLAVAALASGSTHVTSSIANASTKIDPGFNRDSGPQYTVKKLSVTGLYKGCHWIDRPVSSGAPQPKHPGPNGNKVRVCY